MTDAFMLSDVLSLQRHCIYNVDVSPEEYARALRSFKVAIILCASVFELKKSVGVYIMFFFSFDLQAHFLKVPAKLLSLRDQFRDLRCLFFSQWDEQAPRVTEYSWRLMLTCCQWASISVTHVFSPCSLGFRARTSLRWPLVSVEPCVVHEACCVRFWEQTKLHVKVHAELPRFQSSTAICSLTQLV